MTVRIGARELEQRTQRLGREMFERVRLGAPGPLNSQWWEELAMQQCMRHPWLKVQAFRFVDVLPMMHDAREIVRHLREYFVHPAYASEPASHRGPAGAHGNGTRAAERRAALDELSPDDSRGLIRWVSRLMNFERVDSLAARFFSWLAWQSAGAMARRFIAGSNPEQAAAAVRRLRAQRMAFTMDVLGEAALSARESKHYQDIYQDLLTTLPREAAHWPHVPQIDEADGVRLPRINVSVKLSALFPHFDAIDPVGTSSRVKQALRPLLQRAMRAGAHLHVDMEHYAMKDLTLSIFREILMEPEFRDYPHFGIVLQAYLKDGARDAAEIVAFAKARGAPLWVRLVKGAYWDTESVHYEQQGWPWPVWEQKWQSDASYERMSRLLLENHAHVHVAFGSHNVRSLAHAIALREALDVPGAHFELQMLYGMGDPIKHAAVAMGQRCRIYTPYGDILPGMAYLIRRLLENTANESFLRHTADPDTPIDELLADPEAVGRRTPPFEKPLTLKFERGDLIMDPFENVPNTDFTLEDNRRRMRAALQAVGAGLGREYPVVIGGERVVTGQWKESVNPSRPKDVIGRVAQADAAAAERAVQAAARAFESWRRRAPQERADYLFELARLMQQQRFELSALICLECGKPWREADADVSESIDFCNYYGKEMLRLAENPRSRDLPGETNEYFHAPRGVVAVISPWNFPLAILTGMTTAALVTGNTVLMKPAAPASVVCARLMELCEQAGLPAGVLNYLPGPGGSVGELLVKHPQVAMVAFTGSRDVGVRINRLAAGTTTRQPGLKKVIAEMGGKNAIIVDSDADLDEAIKGVLHSAFAYAGQKCSACSRCIVLAGVYERFVDRLVEAARSMSVGPADEPGAFVPPVIDQSAQRSIREFIEIGKAEARCALETDVRALIAQTGGYYVGPTIFADVPPKARIAQEEIFGPVLAIIKAADFAEAVRIFNDTDFALTGGVFSRSPAHLEQARLECQCGNLYINRRISGALVDVQPFGGFKMSGIGAKAGGPDYLIQFCEPRTITENTLRRGFAPSAQAAEATA